MRDEGRDWAERSIPKRILMTTDSVGGVWTYSLELARALADYGIEVGLATMGASLTPTQRAQAAAIGSVRIFESAYKLEWMDGARPDVARAGRWLLNLEAEFHPDIIHLNGYSHGALPWSAPKIVVGHSCVSSWWRAVHGQDAPAEWDDYRNAVAEGLHAADMVVAPSRAMLAALESHYGTFKRGEVIWNGRSLPQLRRRMKHDFVLAAGRLWDPAKNISTLAEVASHLKWPVYVAGQESGPDGRCVRFSNVCCLGHLGPSDIQQWLERAAIYAFPARYEPFGLSVLEAALAGCALVLGDIPSLREIWGDAALFVPPSDPRRIERVLRALMDDRCEIERMSAQARLVAEQLTPQRMASGYIAAYVQVMRERSLQTFPKQEPYAHRAVLSQPPV